MYGKSITLATLQMLTPILLGCSVWTWWVTVSVEDRRFHTHAYVNRSHFGHFTSLYDWRSFISCYCANSDIHTTLGNSTAVSPSWYIVQYLSKHISHKYITMFRYILFWHYHYKMIYTGLHISCGLNTSGGLHTSGDLHISDGVHTSGGLYIYSLHILSTA